MPVTKIYKSNISKAWPLERQISLISAELVTAAGDAVYEDVIPPRRLTNRSPADLEHRARALAPTSRQGNDEILVVAALPVLAFDVVDLFNALAAATERGATVHVLDTGRIIPPGFSPSDSAGITADFQTAKRRAQAAPGGKLGREVAVERVKADTEARVALMRPHWEQRELSNREVYKLGARNNGTPMAPATAKLHLGSRNAAQRRYDRSLERMKFNVSLEASDAE